MIQETSKEAYQSLNAELGERQLIVYHALKDLHLTQLDATDQEIKRFLGKAEANFVRPRRFELVNDKKLIGFSQKRKCKVTGMTSLAWKVVR